MKNQQKAISMPRRLTMWFAAALLASFAVPAVSQATPQKLLQDATEKMISTLREERAQVKARPERLFELVDEVLVPYVDLDGMSRWVLGRNWRTATPEQRQRFTKEFRTLLVRFYVSALLEKPDQLDDLLDAASKRDLISFSPGDVAAGEKKTLVKAEVHLPNGTDVPVNFRLYRRDGDDWKVIDVTVDGVSLVTNYRTSFGTEIQQGGLDSLIDRLAARNVQLLEETKKGNAGGAEGAAKKDK